MFKNLFFLNRAIYETMSKNMVQTDRPQMTSQYGAYKVSCWISKDTCTHTHGHAHKWVMIRERASLLPYTYLVSFVVTETECVYGLVRL